MHSPSAGQIGKSVMAVLKSGKFLGDLTWNKRVMHVLL